MSEQTLFTTQTSCEIVTRTKEDTSPLLSTYPIFLRIPKKKNTRILKTGIFATLFTFFIIRKQTLKQMGSPPYHGGAVCVSP